jgi:hypothetical protein
MGLKARQPSTRKPATRPAARRSSANKARTRSAAPKTVPTGASVDAFLAAIPDEATRRDCEELAEIMRRVSGAEPAMWGTSLVGFGQHRYKYATGREGDWPLTAFSPRRRNLTIYVMPGFDAYGEQLARLGRHRIGRSCLYLAGLEGIDRAALEDMLRDSVERMRAR